MPAYIIVDIKVHHPEPYRDYLKKITPTVAECGGRYLVRGAETEVLHGDWQPARMVVMEFPDWERAHYWATCEEYQPIHQLRQANASVRMILVDGAVETVLPSFNSRG
ncbi:DUF1330 domain-containing protein [Marinimicrobium agarilyticum]|uniref:DUF1330 domain-containing protein n=1 Tax=Marinimicrobium agarilyticum TaxID=306546 RepID=UPI000400006E|nr:DUF1330 domain-containing protein [Marinimicrobium agarilyticum]